MAALHEIARQYAEEIRDGIAWVIIWKTGRSWHAESVRPWTLLWTPYYIEPTPTRNGGTYTNTHGNGEPGRNTSGCL